MSFGSGRIWACVVVTAAFLIDSGARPAARRSADDDQDDRQGHIRHVLLISIDGMHALDFKNCVAAGTCPHLG
jgi:hypothetical protein